MADSTGPRIVVGMADLLERAAADPTGKEGRRAGFQYCFGGDLFLMSRQEEFLRQKGVEIGHVGV